MKRILIGDIREELLSTLEVILKNWGYRALATSDPGEFVSLLDELSPQLIIAGPALLSKKKIAARIRAAASTVLLIEDNQSTVPADLAGERLNYPIDVFRLYETIQKHLEKIPRRHIRLKVHLPGMYYHGEAPCIAEVVSLSSQGLFIRTGSRFEGLEEVRIMLPLIGMQTEIEVRGRIVYRVEPQQGNNYAQGMGIEFKEMDAETGRLLEQFVENLLIAELSEKSYYQHALDLGQLQKHTSDLLVTIRPAG